jgi:hypothetical protein
LLHPERYGCGSIHQNFFDNGDGTATVSGTVVNGTPGTFQITVTATNSVGSCSQVFNVVLV